MLYHMWVRHNLRPGEFWNLSQGERSLLLAFSQEEMQSVSNQVGK